MNKNKNRVIGGYEGYNNGNINTGSNNHNTKSTKNDNNNRYIIK